MTTRLGNVVAITGDVVALGSLAALMGGMSSSVHADVNCDPGAGRDSGGLGAGGVRFPQLLSCGAPDAGHAGDDGAVPLLASPDLRGHHFFVWAGVAYYWSPRTAVLAAALTVGLFARMFAEERLLGAQDQGDANTPLARSVRRRG